MGVSQTLLNKLQHNKHLYNKLQRNKRLHNLLLHNRRHRLQAIMTHNMLLRMLHHRQTGMRDMDKTKMVVIRSTSNNTNKGDYTYV